MRERLLQAIDAALRELLRDAGDSAAPPAFVVEAPRQNDHGDFACNAALLLARRLGRPARDIAATLIAKLGDAGGLLARAEVAGPGFVNLWLEISRWRSALHEILLAGPDCGRSETGAGRAFQVEFVSANPTGPLSVGHGRQAILGDCIARLLEATGWRVLREYYFNDAGRQMRVLGESVRARYLEQLGRATPPDQKAREGLPVVFPSDGYQGDYILDIAASIREREGEGWAREPGDGGFRQEATARIFDGIRRTLDALGVHFDVYSSESSLYDERCVETLLADLRATGLLEERDGALWLRSSELGLPRDRVLVKSDGEHTYLLPDIAYHREKFRRGFERVLDVQGADHKDQAPFVKAAVGLLGLDPTRLEFLFHEFVTLSTGGRKVKQSTRRATFITADELLAEVGVDVFRYFMIERRAQSHLDFDLELAKERDWTRNPAYYVQYAHARTHGIERQARARGVMMPTPEQVETEALALAEELELIRKLSVFREVVARAAETREPHHLAYYLREVAGLWNPYVQDSARHRVLGVDPALTRARLGLTLAVRFVLAAGLDLLGMSAPEQM